GVRNTARRTPGVPPRRPRRGRREEGGPAVPSAGDPWPVLDVPARALTVQTAALAVAKSVAAERPLDEVEQAVVDACVRMGAIPPEFAHEGAQ
ncbi:hypothetical protein ACWDAZ_41905, partial [Streptomyces sp. NPDC001215]